MDVTVPMDKCGGERKKSSLQPVVKGIPKTQGGLNKDQAVQWVIRALSGGWGHQDE